MGALQRTRMGYASKNRACVEILMLALLALLLACCPQLARDAHAADGDSSTLKAADVEEAAAYAILYDNGDLVFQRGDAEDASKGVALDKWTEFEGELGNRNSVSPWSDRRFDVKRVFVSDAIHPVSTRYWFYGFANVTSISLSGLDTSSTADMSGMFDGCSSLTSLDLSGLDTSSTADMPRMFRDCWSLSSLDLSGFDASNVTDMSGMFNGCDSLAYLKTGAGWTVPSSKGDGNLKFEYDPAFPVPMRDESGTVFAGGLVPSGAHEYVGCGECGQVAGAWGTCPWVYDADGSMTVRPGKGGLYEYPWQYRRVKSVVFAADGDRRVVALGSMSHMFSNCDSLTSLDLSGLDTSNVTDMSGVFHGCCSLTSFDLSGLDTSSVTDMSHMFSDCDSLTSLDLSGLDTSNVTDMSFMFSNCDSLTSLDLSGLDTSSVKDMTWMFSNCSSLASLDLSSFDTSSVEELDEMFFACTSLAKVRLGAKAMKIGPLPSRDARGNVCGWKSTANGKGYTSSDIISGRLGIADTYTRFVLRHSIKTAKVTLPKKSFAYKGKQLKPAATVKLGGKTLKPGVDYSASYSSNVHVGTATVTVTGKGSYVGKAKQTFKIVKAANPMKAAGKTIGLKASVLAKGAVAKTARAAFSVTGAKGKVAYRKKSGNAKVAVSSGGKVTVKKGLKKGVYKVKVAVTAAGNKNYKKATKRAILTVRVA